MRRHHGIIVRRRAKGLGWRVTIYDHGTRVYWYLDGPELSTLLDKALAAAKRRILAHRG